MVSDPLVGQLVLLLGLGLFFGLAFEEFHAQRDVVRPGGIRTFPLLALTGAILYRLDPTRLVLLTGGLLVIGGWLAVFYTRRIGETDDQGRANVGIVVMVCNLLAFLLGPVALAGPAWLAVGVTVVAVVLLTSRARLHDLARQVEAVEIITAVKFLILTGLIVPLLPNQPVTSLTDLTPRQVWLAVVAVCSLSYASYLVQRYLAPKGATLWVAVLGGMYSSTATTIVLARRVAAVPAEAADAGSGIIIASSIMYLRLLVIVAIFNHPMAIELAGPAIALAVLGLLMAFVVRRRAQKGEATGDGSAAPGNPLELNAALIFAALFVVISIATAWVKAEFGLGGIYGLAAIVGIADIDPFVLGLADGGAADLPVRAAAVAMLIAASSNDLLKAGYTGAFAGPRSSVRPIAALVVLAGAGLAAAFWLA
ncbi:MAG TPA: DUF4010 domain-containing protein [Stellaceae bacterium]|nr:DUF4010 domain-containing protein [Stellaceae bacterium]